VVVDLQDYKKQWVSNIRGDVLAGITATLALIPDSLAFSFIAGVNPMVGIYSSICILLIISFFGGRPGMISASAGSMSVLMITLVVKHGVEYLFAATILTGILQFFMGVFKFGRFMKFVPHSVITGFVNSLAILIFLAQFKYFQGESLTMYIVVVCTLAIIYILPRFTKAIPSPLVGVAIMTAVVVFSGLPTKSVGDIAEIVPTMPAFLFPDVPINWETLAIILPYAMSLAIVGYAETLLTQDIIDSMTGSSTDKNKEMKGQGLANVVTGFFGGMAGCALIAESVINIKVGGRGRLSTLVAALFLLLLVFVLSDVMTLIPIAALVGVMLMVCFELFDWKYVGRLRQVPRSEAIIMLSTVGIVLYTHDLAIGVLSGVVLSAIVFVYKASVIKVNVIHQEGETVYRVHGQLFFASVHEFQEKIDYSTQATSITIDLSEAHVWDHTSETVLSRIKDKLEEVGKKVHIQRRHAMATVQNNASEM
jgi:sulfate permease, SulP family